MFLNCRINDLVASKIYLKPSASCAIVHVVTYEHCHDSVAVVGRNYAPFVPNDPGSTVKERFIYLCREWCFVVVNKFCRFIQIGIKHHRFEPDCII